MNRSHKQQLERLRSQNEYTKKDIEIGNELLKQDDPAFHEEVVEAIHKVKKIINENNEK